MVFGNLNDNSGTGVLFTHDPVTGRGDLNGAFKYNAQGNDIVDGVGGSLIDIENLKKQHPALYARLSEIADKLLGFFGAPQDIEYTMVAEGSEIVVYALQTRDLKIQHDKFPVFDEEALKGMRYIGLGYPVSGGAYRGQVIMDVKKLSRPASSGSPEVIGLIYIAQDLVPDDMDILLAADGFMIQKGSPTSHASISLRALRKPGILLPGLQKERGWVRIGENIIRERDFLSIDGRTGAVYLGAVPLKLSDDGKPVLE
jgi:pyruvate,orthophosphate dikinase